VIDTIMENLLQQNDKMDVEKKTLPKGSRSLASEINDADFSTNNTMLGYPSGPWWRR